MRKPHRVSRHRRGIIAALVAVCLVAVLMIAAISIDGGRILDIRRQAKAAADAAARSAAIEMLDMVSGNNTSVNTSTIRATAFRVAADNGFTNDGANSIVTVNTPPTTGAYSGQNGFIEVIIESKLDRGFSRLLSSDTLSVVARSVGAGTYVPTKGTVLVLNPKKKESLTLGNHNSALFVNGDVAVNSTHKEPAKFEKGAQLHATNIMFSSSLGSKRGRDVQKNIQGQLSTRVPATKDPFSGLAVPSPGTTQKLSDYKSSAGGVDTFNLQPGRYTEDWNFDHKDVVNLAPGTYYLDKKHIDIKDTASMYGNEVTIYSAGNQELKFHTKGDIQLSPPTSGTYAGISIFKDPTAKGRISFEKDSNLNINGAIYAPSSLVQFKKTSTNLGDDDTSAWDNLDVGLDDSDDDASPGDGSMGASLIVDMLRISENSVVRLSGSNLNLQRPILGLVE
jgi:Flp pilus assembly protein TadG